MNDSINSQCGSGNQYDRICKSRKGYCRGEFASVHVKLDKLDEAIRGNGKPGIQLRLDRLESAEAVRSRLLWIIAGSTVTLAVGAVWKLIFG